MGNQPMTNDYHAVVYYHQRIASLITGLTDYHAVVHYHTVIVS